MTTDTPTTDTSLLAEDLAVFADLGTEPPRLAVSGDRLTVRLFREGEQLELLFHDNGSGKIVERAVDSGEMTTHASYRALLASRRFGDLRRWADHQKRSMQEYLRDFIDPIPVKGQLFSSDISMDLSDFDDFLMAPHPRDQRSVRIILVDGPAGIGKTKFIELLASSRASRFTTTQCPLVLHVQSRGRVLTFLQDLIAFSLQRLRVNVTFDQLPVLVRHGLVTLAIDGFDELGDPNGYELAWAQVNEMVDQVRGRGTLILAGRETFLGPDRIESSIKSLTEHDVIDALSLRPPTSETARQWLMKRNWSAEDLRSAEALLEDDSYALRPFFLAEIANPEAISTIRDEAMANPLPFLAELMIEREASKFGDAIDRIMDWTQRRDYLRRLLREIARCMADDQTEAIDELMLTWLVEFAAPDSADQEILALLKNRAAVMVFLENDAAPRHRRFTNSQVSNHFLSDVTIDAISRREIPKYVHRNPLGADFLDAFSDLSLHFAASDRDRVRRFFEAASELVRTYSWIDQGVRNLGALLITMLPAMEGVDNLRLRNLDMDEALLQGTAPSAEIHKVFVNQLDVRGADLQDLTFDSAAITTLVVDETTRVPPSLPVPSQIQCEGFRGRSTAVITHPSSIESWLDRHGRRGPPADQGDSGLVPNELRDHPLPRLLGRACRSKLHWIPLDRKGDFPQFVADTRWRELLSLLEEHGLARRERKSTSGRRTDLVHVKRSKAILSEDSQDAQIRAFYESLVKRIRAENPPGA